MYSTGIGVNSSQAKVDSLSLCYIDYCGKLLRLEKTFMHEFYGLKAIQEVDQWLHTYS